MCAVSKQPEIVRAPTKMVELSGACTRGEDGRVWRLDLWNQPANAPAHHTIQLKTAPTATNAVRLDGCHATRADGSTFLLEKPKVEDYNVAMIVPPPTVREGATPPAGATSRIWSRSGECELRADQHVRCEATVLGKRGVWLKPLHRSTLPVRVIPQ